MYIGEGCELVFYHYQLQFRNAQNIIYRDIFNETDQ